MPENQDYRDLLNEKFKSLNDKIDTNNANTHEMLTNIVAQTTKTNGKVIELEKKVGLLEISEITHGLRCPQNHKFDNLGTDIQDLKKSLEDASFFIRHPKLGLGIIVIAVIITLFSYFSVENYIQHLENDKAKIEATE